MKLFIVLASLGLFFGCGEERGTNKKIVQKNEYELREMQVVEHRGDGLVLLEGPRVGDEVVVKIRMEKELHKTVDIIRTLTLVVEKNTGGRTYNYIPYDCGMSMREILGKEVKKVKFNENERKIDIQVNNKSIFVESVVSQSLVLDEHLREYSFVVSEEMLEKKQQYFKLEIVPLDTIERISVGIVGKPEDRCDVGLGKGHFFVEYRDPSVVRRELTFDIPYKFALEVRHIPKL